MYALFNLIGELAVRQVSPLTTMSFAQWFSSLGLLLYLWRNISNLPWHNVSILGISLALATIASIFPFYLILVGIQRIGAGQTAILSTFELPMTFVLAAVFLAEIPQWNQYVGGALVLLGIILLYWRNRK